MIKRLIVFLSLFVLVLGSTVSSIHSLEFPTPQGYVNDFAGILSPETKQTLEQELIKLDQESSIEIAIVTVKSLEETTIEDYAVRLFEDWKIGKKGKDNGVLLLIAPEERELRIEVGYGLEPILTDSKAGRIIRNIITPEFKKEDYDVGVVNGLMAIVKVVKAEDVDLGEESSLKAKSLGGSFWVLFVIGSIFLLYISAFLARSKRFWPGGVIGGILGAILGVVLFTSLIKAFLTATSLGILGFVFDYILSKNYKERKKKGLPTSWRRSGGGFFGGGKSSSSSGGFGGFGGGSSGGGGASGGW